VCDDVRSSSRAYSLSSPRAEPDSMNIADGIRVLCGVAPLTLTEYDVILKVIEDLNHLPVASVYKGQVCVTDVMNECDDNCDVNDVDDDDDDDVGWVTTYDENLFVTDATYLLTLIR